MIIFNRKKKTIKKLDYCMELCTKVQQNINDIEKNCTSVISEMENYINDINEEVKIEGK